MDARIIYYLTKDGFVPYKEGYRFKFGKEIIFVDDEGYKVVGVDDKTLKEIKDFMKNLGIKENKNKLLEQNDDDIKNILTKYFKFEDLTPDDFGRYYSDHAVTYKNGTLTFYTLKHDKLIFEERKKRWKQRLAKYGVVIKHFEEDLFEQ